MSRRRRSRHTSGRGNHKTAATRDRFGHFTSIWRIQKDGSWKVEVDLGIQHEKRGRRRDVKTVDTPKDNARPEGGQPLVDWQNELLDLDKALAKRAEAEGVEKAFDSVRRTRSGCIGHHQPALGKAAA